MRCTIFALIFILLALIKPNILFSHAPGRILGIQIDANILFGATLIKIHSKQYMYWIVYKNLKILKSPTHIESMNNSLKKYFGEPCREIHKVGLVNLINQIYSSVHLLSDNDDTEVFRI